jgi:hypothetical protein
MTLAELLALAMFTGLGLVGLGALLLFVAIF